MAQEPMIKLEPGGTAPILSYNVPEPTSYTGRHILELEFPPEWFTAAALEVPPPPPPPTPQPTGPILPPIVVLPIDPTRATERILAAPAPAAAMAAPAPGALARTIIAETRPPVLKFADAEEASLRARAGFRFVRYVDLAGEPAARVLPPIPPEPRPRLLLVEIYRLSSYLGAYGAGRVLKTFTLLPGEKTKISVKTYTKRTTDAKQASSILDSFTKESADDFETSMSQEQSDKTTESENFEYHAEAEASASWGFGSAKVSGGVKGGTSASREEFAKNVSNATQKHTAKASAKRDVQVNTSYEVKEETGEETSIERTIENVNLSRTLNFVFRQMNQQFVTILHLVDVRLSFFNGYPAMAHEVTLPEIDRLLGKYVKPERHAEVREAILTQVRSVRDHEGIDRPFIDEVDLGGNDKYLRVRRDLLFSYTEPVTDQKIDFTGVPLAVEKYTMRTEGVIVEALLGQADALDDYAKRLQEIEVRRRQADVEKLEAEARKAELIVSIAESGDADAAKILVDLLCPCGPPPPAPPPAPTPTPPPH
ncbi:MAG TPA: hypothetical protein VGQ52_01930 [Gemmatimonadaceae bacterium]|jgi:hypothetical protein|nr:hypothetical protein [Gemmatimonadaceae bacterium]